jgi:hypothetical protein
VVPQGNGIGMFIELLLAINSGRELRLLQAESERQPMPTLNELRRLALAVNRADLDQATGILELARGNNRLRRLDGLVLLVTRHYIAFGMYSKLDSVALLKPDALTLTPSWKSETVGREDPLIPDHENWPLIVARR